MVKAATGEVISAEDLGGADVHCRESGVTDHYAENDQHALVMARRTMATLNLRKMVDIPLRKPLVPRYDPAELNGVVPVNIRTPYDVREVLCRLLDIRRNRRYQAKSTADPYSPWSSGLCFRLNQPNYFEVVCAGQSTPVKVQLYPAGDEYRLVTLVAAFTASRAVLHGKELTCSLNSARVTATLVHYGEQVSLFYNGEMYHVLLPDPGLGDSDFSGADSSLRAPIPGKVTKVVGTAGGTVRKGEPLLVLEAMKMEYM